VTSADFRNCAVGLLALVTAFAACDAWQAALRIERESTDTLRAMRVLPERLAGIVDSRSDELVQLTAQRTDELLRRADHRLQAVQIDLDDVLTRANGGFLGEVTALRTDIGATLEETRQVERATRRAIELLTPQALGLVAAHKVLAGEAASAARRIDAAVPDVLGQVHTVGANVARATDEYAATGQQTRIAMSNLAQATRPLPRWMRIPLSITGAIAPTAAGALGAAAATGAFR